MPVDAERVETTPVPDLRETERRVQALRDELILVRDHGAQQAEASREARESSIEEQRRDRERRERRLERELADSLRRAEAERRRLEEVGHTRHARLAKAAEGLQSRLDAKLEEDRKRTNVDVQAIRKELEAENALACAPLETRLKRWEDLRPEVGRHGGRAEEAVAWFSSRHGVSPDPVEDWIGAIDVEEDPDRLADETLSAFEEVLKRVKVASGRWTSGLARLGVLVVWQSVLLLLGAGAVGFALQSGAAPKDLAPIVGTVLVLTVLLHLASRSRRRRFRAIANELSVKAAHHAQRFERHARAAQRHLEAKLLEQGENHVQRLRQAEGRERDASLGRTSAERRQLEWLEKRKEGAESRLRARLEEQARALEEEEKQRRESLRAEVERETEEKEEAHRTGLAGLEAEDEKRERTLRERGESAVADFSLYAAAIGETVGRRSGSWEEMEAEPAAPPETATGFVPLGRLRLALPALLGEDGESDEGALEFELPIATSFPEHGSLLVEHPPAERDRAVRVLLNTILRSLIAFPPGKVRLTILDPVGLGQSFSALMHLADHDEQLVNSRIWTETSHIERRLADLSEHIEKVIQKYLRNRYDSIGEYNAEAGDLQEPYHFLVIADFPTGFNDLAAERLASIISSGPRCGVYTLIAHDTRQSVLSPVDLDLLRRNGPTLRVEGKGWRLFGDLLGSGEFRPESLPSPGFTNALLDRVGEMSVAASSVELPFEAVAPGDGALWSGSTAKGVRVAIGRTGAERLQILDLGRGTAQHALVAGRTGSGKSTLFHVMITNMALWFSPDELQFYLVDFKKGVEFKVFATFGLPHARVVAIESDREFGLSVLRAVDAELTRRGDLFRSLGVQDLSAYRRRAEGEPLPRTLLLIDEFQEFFTDDDSVAHDSATLLDRFVRQGRAFGIHVVLGSQTLSGIYTLARGTLGQMGVRIALQCNEADSYLILSEENGVARLLSRPGEAIYNDKSGLLAGNNPFQVVWLPEQVQERHLRLVAERAAATPEIRVGKTTVFEGNQPANILENAELMSLIADGAPDDGSDDRVWLGEPNAIKGPTEVRFLPASGSNLLIVGQRREAVFAMMAASVVSLSARHRGRDLRIVILDGGGNEPEFAAHFENLLAAVPHHVERYDLRTTPEAVADVAELVDARADDRGEPSPVYVFAFGLQRLRMLRKQDDFSMSFGEEEGESSGDRFATILTDGPPRHVHTIIWCDTVPNLQRTLSRRAMREFDVRVLFQMSAADSSELIESSAGNRLGLNSALMAVESLGTFEKFRPYAIPAGDVMRRLGGSTGGDA